MNELQWKTLVSVIRGETLPSLPTGFIIDSPWLPKWAGHTILDYFTDDRIFYEDNVRAARTFPGVLFLPDSGPNMHVHRAVRWGSFNVRRMIPFARVQALPRKSNASKNQPWKKGFPFVIKRLIWNLESTRGHQIRLP
jgi:hypothetical protein